MSRQSVLSTPVRPYAERKTEIERSVLPRNLGALLDEVAAEIPDQVALHLIENDETLTYAALRGAVNRFANGLKALGVRKGHHIGVMLPNVKAFPITWLAIARLGAVMIPVNVRYTPRELHYVLDDGEADFLVIAAGQLPVFEEVKADLPRIVPDHVVVLGGEKGPYRSWDAVADASDDFQESEPVGPEDLLNIQYTSGTTGFPKGCMLTQDYWLVIGKVNATRDGRVMRNLLAPTPFFYMDPQWLLLMAFYQRGTLFLAPRQSGSRFMEWVRRYKINFCLLPGIILNQPPSGQDRDHELVKVNMYGFPKGNHALLEARFDLIAREAFGMTEIGSGVFMPIEETGSVGSGSCGVAAPFRETRIVDEHGNDVPDGAMGELVVRGRGILKGYYRKPEATANAFFGEWFRTGDLFVRAPSGWHTIVGRVKDMIRRAGENIAAREVEAVLAGLPEIAEPAALPVPDATRGEEVKAYIVLKPGFAGDEALLRKIEAHCVANLASFKVPRYYEFRESLPKTPSEKVAKHVLKAEKPDLRSGSWDRVENQWH